MLHNTRAFYWVHDLVETTHLHIFKEPVRNFRLCSSFQTYQLFQTICPKETYDDLTLLLLYYYFSLLRCDLEVHICFVSLSASVLNYCSRFLESPICFTRSLALFFQSYLVCSISRCFLKHSKEKYIKLWPLWDTFSYCFRD